MVKKERKKSEGRTPTLAPFVDAPFKIYMTTGGKEYDGQVLSSGIIKIDEKEFTSPSSAGSYILGNDKNGKPLQVDGWKSWKMKLDGQYVELNTLRGKASPLKATEAKPRKAKTAKKAKVAKTKAVRAKRAQASRKKAPKDSPAEHVAQATALAEEATPF